MCSLQRWWRCRGSPPGRLRRCPLPSWPSSAPSRRRWRAGPAWRGWRSQSSLTARSSTRPPAPVTDRQNLILVRDTRRKADFLTFILFCVLLSDTHVIVLVKIGLLNFLALIWAAVCQDVNDGLLVGSWRGDDTKQRKYNGKQCSLHD